MPAYAVALLSNIRNRPEINEYLRRIDATLAPFGGRFLVHGGRADVLEGDWHQALVVIEFADRQRAHDWYASADYQAILPLRTRNADGMAAIVEGVPDGYSATARIAD